MASPFPFDAIVVTSPDPNAAPLSSLKAVVPDNVTLYSTSDPFGARCGSGGGTLAALEVIGNSNEKTVLIVHAGGESSRCPTQMATGKAWTSLPLQEGNIGNPTQLLVTQLSEVFAELPRSSVVVAASDCLLHLPTEHINYGTNENTVTGLAVPAPLSTACNHGVYCINETRVEQFLQKPSIECMKTTPHCVIQNSDNAWVDTGVVAFLPGAASVLRHLVQTMDHCTRGGLRRLHRQSSSSESLEDFSQRFAYQIDLYTHIMLSLSIDSFSNYQDVCGDRLPKATLQEIYTAFSSCSLSALALDNGCFRHLGTSKELVEFLCGQDDMAQLIGLTKRARAFANCSQVGSVLTNVVIDTDDSCSIGSGTVLEHVHVSSKQFDVGTTCLLSGIRGRCSFLQVPNNMCFQMLPVKNSSATIYMYLGLQDNVKKADTFWGISVEALLCDGILDPSDIWKEVDTDQRTLWNARLHPLVDEPGTCEHDKLFSWIATLQRQHSLQTPSSSLAYWKSLPRLSLSEIRQASDAVRELQYREHLELQVFPEYTSRYLRNIRDCIATRLHKECKLESFVACYASTQSWEGVREVFLIFEAVVRDAFEKQSYDIAGRAFMILSEFVYQLGADTESMPASSAELSHRLSEAQQAIGGGPLSLESISILFHLFDMLPHSNGDKSLTLKELARTFEMYASAMTKLCVASPALVGGATFSRSSPAPRDTWVIATAPARIDLSGGWSDTPPICVEHGGAVCGVAVTVDGLLPLSCRSRVVTGTVGITLRAEARDWNSGDLLEETSTVILAVGDLSGYNDPRAKCSLVKCALVYLGLVSVHSIDSANKTDDISNYMTEFCGGGQNVGLEIVTTSLLPHGSGMGTSSILGGCILASVAKCVGLDVKDDDLVHHVSMLEQMLSTGGGWQDQMGGLYGGTKLGQSVRGLPLTTTIEAIQLSPTIEEEINRRLVLIFTGQTRLAKDILQNVLRRWARRSKEIVETVEELTTTAYRARDCLAAGDVDALADCLNLYWKQKKAMAGESSEPSFVRYLLSELFARDIIAAGSLCGAGGGGFMVVFLREGHTSSEVKSACLEMDGEAASCTIHECRVSTKGLSTIFSSETEYQLDWHKG